MAPKASKKKNPSAVVGQQAAKTRQPPKGHRKNAMASSRRQEKLPGRLTRAQPLYKATATAQPSATGQVEDHVFVDSGSVISSPPLALDVLHIGSPQVEESNGIHSITLPLGCHVPLPIKNKIWQGEFVDLAALLCDQSTDRESAPTFVISPTGALSVTTPRPKNIMSIEQWTDAFLVFTAIAGARHPERTPELLKYISIIREAAHKFPGMGWREYDLQFRRRQAINPTRSYSTLDGELWYTVLMPSVLQRGYGPSRPLIEQGAIRAPFPTVP